MWLMKLLAVGLVIAAVSAAEEKLSEHAATLADASIKLGLNLYHAMAKDKATRNILLSPVVLASSLGTVSLGGQDSTASEAKALLDMSKVQDDKFHLSISQLLAEVSNSKARNGTWRIGSQLYGPTSVKFTEDFVQKSKKHYNLEHSKINFRDKKGALKAINEWAAKTTDGKLPEITKDLEKTDGAMIINAMFFKPHWNEKFHHKMVDQRSFMVTRSETVAIDMMHRTGLYNFYVDEANEVYVLEMQLSAERSSVIFIMPFQLQPLDGVEKLLTKEQINAWVSKMKKRAVAISLPKGTFGVSHQLQKHLGSIGLTTAVDKSKADLSKISGKKDLYLASIVHGTALEWSTDGDPYDAFIYSREELKNPEVFYADHPFIFLVKDKRTGSFLFVGRLIRPDGRKMHDEL
ncbi:serpin H1-like [Pristis pectinata]|uniref:serpin H1-like n=1 Tax=Pristis pectinata TaxID=685728 RepID=UPI00223DF91C|nr:serpin H1-like [Pristis pectinata]XP_051881663.1 serpin H1-like [Pristis pectinata]XP_051881664.1 serpin H1-like [Pristis pectinata]XP_051881665.1 serpin H1-like [Pristis pectinata]XP_051881667.1 serpin H1-like [Pristis pectinata]